MIAAFTVLAKGGLVMIPLALCSVLALAVDLWAVTPYEPPEASLMPGEPPVARAFADSLNADRSIAARMFFR